MSVTDWDRRLLKRGKEHLFFHFDMNLALVSLAYISVMVFIQEANVLHRRVYDFHDSPGVQEARKSK